MTTITFSACPIEGMRLSVIPHAGQPTKIWATYASVGDLQVAAFFECAFAHAYETDKLFTFDNPRVAEMFRQYLASIRYVPVFTDRDDLGRHAILWEVPGTEYSLALMQCLENPQEFDFL